MYICYFENCNTLIFAILRKGVHLHLLFLEKQYTVDSTTLLRIANILNIMTENSICACDLCNFVCIYLTISFYIQSVS